MRRGILVRLDCLHRAFFMLTAFYLTTSTFNSLNPSQVKRRIFRICVSYLSYAFIAYIVISLFNVLKNKSIVPFKDLVWQLFLGSSPKLDPPCGFSLIWLFSQLPFFLYLNILSIKNYVFYDITGSFCFQYTKLNFFLFSWMPYEAKRPFGRLLEMFRYACGGVLLGESQVLKKCE